MRSALTASHSTKMNKESDQPEYTCISWREVFALATLGGAQVLGLEEEIGNFEVGKYFDALVVDPFGPQNPFHIFHIDSFEDIIQKFIFLGDDRSYSDIYVAGKKVDVEKLKTNLAPVKF
jgi:guanine deaminase